MLSPRRFSTPPRIVVSPPTSRATVCLCRRHGTCFAERMEGTTVGGNWRRTTMSRFILRFTGRGTTPEADLERIRSAPGVTILESASPRMLLVQAAPQAIGQLIEDLSGWIHTPEQTIPLPNP